MHLLRLLYPQTSNSEGQLPYSQLYLKHFNDELPHHNDAMTSAIVAELTGCTSHGIIHDDDAIHQYLVSRFVGASCMDENVFTSGTITIVRRKFP